LRYSCSKRYGFGRLAAMANLWLCGLVLAALLLQPEAQSSKKKFPSSEEQPDVREVGIEAVLKWSQERVLEAEREFTDKGYSRLESPFAWDSEVVYYVMVDRFANGDLANDNLNPAPGQVEQMTSDSPYTVGMWRHGGDLAGLRHRLGYLHHLGITTIWISPILLNNAGSPWGYYLSDPSMVDPGFGSKELLREVVRDAHFLGIRVVLDIVTNMAESVDFGYESDPNIDQVTACANHFEDQYWNTSLDSPLNLSNTSKLTWGSQLPNYLKNETFFQRCGSKNLYRPMGEPFDNLPTDIDDYRATYRDAGYLWPENFAAPGAMPDFATMNPNWQELYTNLMKYWVAYADLDGFRLDATKYISADIVAYFSTEVRSYAQGLGKSNFFLTGEILSPGEVPFAYLYLGHAGVTETQSSCMANTGCMGQGLIGECCPTPEGVHLRCCFDDRSKDKPVPKRVHDMVEKLQQRASTLAVTGPALPTFYPTNDHSALREIAQASQNASYWWTDMLTVKGRAQDEALLTAPGTVDNWTWQVVDSQDIQRLLQSPYIPMDLWRLEPSFVWLFTWYGIPAVYYGMEQGLNGRCYKYDSHGKNPESIIEGSIKGGPRKKIMDDCEDYKNDALKRQDFFSGGPFILGSAVPEVQAEARISGKMMDTLSPYWCEEPLLNREHKIYRLARALSRVRRSCRVLAVTKSAEALSNETAPSSVLAYWKYTTDPSIDGPHFALVVLEFEEKLVGPLDFIVPDELKDEVDEGEEFVDLLNPKRTAKFSRGKLLVGGNNELVRAAVFVPTAATQTDSGDADWLVCSAGAKRLPPLPDAQECVPTFMWAAVAVAVLTLLLLALILYRGFRKSGIFLCIVKEPTAVEVLESPELGEDFQDADHVFVAAIEHTIPDRKVKVSAGGLGKVLDQMLREHPPGRLSLVHPKFAGVDYGELTPFVSLEVTVDSHKELVQVYTCESYDKNIHRVWFLLEHKWFETLISKDNPYPYPMTKLAVLRFFSLWNQASAQLMMMLKPDIYHCMDYHAAMIPLYVPPTEQIPTIIVLHNADYDGAIETDFVTRVLWKNVPAMRRLSLIFNLRPETIKKYLTFEGRFNMLWGGISFTMANQGGHGICTVSGKYAAELKRERTMFKCLPAVLPLDNAIDSAADDGPKTVEELQKYRAGAKRALQEFCELNVDPEAKILIFVGRWVKQKGVDHIALMAASILDKFPEVQFVLAGPPGDPFGNYAQELLRPLTQHASYMGRLFVVTRFFLIPKEARAGAHLCLMPSCSEPFGYVDVEFGLLGVPSLGCAIGGLGKMPGVYFRQQNSDSQDMLIAGFGAAVQYALTMPDDQYWEMALNCIPAQFPFSTWRSNLQAIYRTAQVNFQRDAVAARQENLVLDAEMGANVLMERPENKGFGYSKLAAHDIRMIDRKRSGGYWMQDRMQRMQVVEATEFLGQPVSEQRVKELMAIWMQDNQDTDAETLQSYISLASQRMSERNYATQSLMKPCRALVGLLGYSCLRIHFFIALGYIVSPVIDERLSYLDGHAEALQDYRIRLLSGILGNVGSVLGAFLWLGLSYQVPANLLMAVSLFMTERLCSVTGRLSEEALVWILLFKVSAGVMAAARWLFLIWNFNEDFHGGFQVGTRRVAIIESCRQILAGLLKAWGESGVGLQSSLLSFVVLLLIILVLLAPACYSSYVLPRTNFMKELKDHKVYILLILSMAINGLGYFCWGGSKQWLSYNGWRSDEVSIILTVQTAVLAIVLFFIFFCLYRMSVWGPWAMRDFVCFVPPGSILYALAFWELGRLHYRSYIFVAILTLGLILDVARFAAFWTAILTTLANKWYALVGVFLGFAVIKACEALSPVICHLIGIPWGYSPVFSGMIEYYPQSDLYDLQKAVILTVWPLAFIAYILQLLTRRYFNQEVLTFKGFGNRMPDGSKGWEQSRSVFIHSSKLNTQVQDNSQLVEESDTDASFDSDASWSQEENSRV